MSAGSAALWSSEIPSAPLTPESRVMDLCQGPGRQYISAGSARCKPEPP